MKYFILLLVISCNLNSLPQDKKTVQTVKYVDLKKYVGLWYEISKIPNRFQKQCISNATAKYILDEDGDIKVVNSCVDDENEMDIAEGVAKVVDKKSNAKLEVSFVSFLGIRPFWGDYWIIGLDDNYNWAVVGTPDRKYGWVLSRTPELADEILLHINNILKENGYKPESFVKSPH
ncbi:MAG: lipocalin family protein [Ignavibacteriales bacterium]|nr:MAG: lipocalin family protein [Ignavibacteriales bacterium]